jgi:exopolysaccharide/PEP-CTERM locus tyrosine autokinase
MEIELRIIRDPYAELPKQRVRVFGESGGQVGRSADSYWQLPDPKCYLSGHHCKILFLDDAFWILDTSVNGVFINGSLRPIGFGRKVRLAHGDEIRLASYTAMVGIRKPANQRPGLAEGGLNHGSPIEPEELFAEAFAATSVDESQDFQQVLAQEVKGDLEHMDAPLRELEPVADEAVEPVNARIDDLSGAPAANPEPAPREQPVEPALLAAAPPRLVHIDRDRLQAEGLLPSGKMERLLSNQFRHIKRPLINNALGRGRVPVPNGHRVMVTSSLPGEGKTFSSLNLALSIAREKDVEVVLIDADVAKSTMSRIFALQDAPGLINALADDLLDVESLILPTDVKGLSLLPAGQCAKEDISTELLASTRMEAVAARIGARSAHRIALFDSPPLLVTNEARVLASLMGQILLVVRAGVTPQQAVLEAIHYVDEEKPLGLMLNQSKGHAPGSYYGYGDYGYGDYGTDENAGGASAKPPP